MRRQRDSRSFEKGASTDIDMQHVDSTLLSVENMQLCFNVHSPIKSKSRVKRVNMTKNECCSCLKLDRSVHMIIFLFNETVAYLPELLCNDLIDKYRDLFLHALWSWRIVKRF